MASEEANELECGVCLETFCDPRILPCGHSFCFECLQKQIGNKKIENCATCRVQFSVPSEGVQKLTKNYSLIGLLNLVNASEHHSLPPSVSSEKTIEIKCSIHANRSASIYCRLCNCFACVTCCSSTHSKHNGIEMRYVAIEFENIISKAKNDAAKMMEANEKNLVTIQNIFSAISHDLEKKSNTQRQLVKRCADVLSLSLVNQSQFISKLPKFQETSVTNSSKWVQNVTVVKNIKCQTSELKYSDISVLFVRDNSLIVGSETSGQIVVFDKSSATVSNTFETKKKVKSAVLTLDSRVMFIASYDVLMLPNFSNIKAGLHKPYILGASKTGEIFVSDFSKGVYEYDHFNGKWKLSVPINNDKQCWHAVKIDNQLHSTTTFWVIEYVHRLQKFQIQEYKINNGSVESVAVSTDIGDGKQIALAKYGYFNYDCGHMVYDGEDSVFVKECTKEGKIHVLSVTSKAYVCTLTIQGVTENKSLGYDYASHMLYIGQSNGVILECLISERRRHHELKVCL